MKIYSWNMLFSNKRLDRAFDFITNTDFDIFCLQEVPENFFERIRSHFPIVAFAIEGDRIFKGVKGRNYLVLISRYPLLKSTAVPINSRTDASMREKWFVRLMLALGLWGIGRGNRHRLHADIAHPTFGTVRVYNLHLPLRTPAQRLEEFESALGTDDKNQPTIVCGDFNIIESLHINILNWIFGGHLSDVIFWWRERRRVESRFLQFGFANPLRGKSTHPLSRSQLDHILVSKSFSIKNATVVTDRRGSDHCPITVEIGTLRT